MNKLLKIQSGLVCPKTSYNSFGKYHYRSCEAILEALKPLLIENNLTLTLSDEIVPILDRIYVKATVILKDEEKIISEVQAYAREEESKKGMDGAQVTGAASSYARKYALNGMFCIDDTKDADYTNNGKEEKKIEKKADGTVDRREVYEEVIQPLSAQDLADNCDASEDIISSTISEADSIEELTKCKKDLSKDWNRLKKYRAESFDKLVYSFEEKEKELMK